MLPETTSHVYTGPFPSRWSGWNFEHLINDMFVSTTEFLHKGILLCIFAGIKPITFRSLTQAAWLCFSSCLRDSSIHKFSQDNERVRLICAYCRTRMESGDVLTFFVCVCPQMVKTTGGPAMGGSVSSPALTNAAVTLLQDNLSEEERQLWTSLGPNWTLPRLDFVTRSVFSAGINNIFVSVCLSE